MRPFAALRLGNVLVGLALWMAVSLAALAQDVLPVPPLSGRVIDETGSLDGVASEALATSLAAIETKRGSQVIVLIVATTQPEDIAAYAQRVGDTWKIGRRGAGDGLLIVVAKDDRSVRIEVSKALEGAIPDLMAKRLIEEQLVPAFRAGNFFDGLNGAAIRIDHLIAGEGWPAPTPPPGRSDRSRLHKDIAVTLAVGLGLALTLWAGSKMPHPVPQVSARRRRDKSRDDDVGIDSKDSDDRQWTRNDDSGSSSDSGSTSGGSFSSGGGGDFGGGGASGKW